LYDAVYDNLEEVILTESVNVIYDSVVLQHIVSAPYVTGLVNQFVRMPTLNAVVSLSIHTSPPSALRLLIDKHGWKRVLLDADTQTFSGGHDLVVLIK
jgi:hypothetical protein